MPIINTVSGNLIELFKENKFDGIAHGCNCFHSMGADIAASIREEFIEAYKADINLSQYGSQLKLGSYTAANVKFGTIFNLYTQYRPGSETEENLYLNIENVFKLLSSLYGSRPTKFHLGIPLIGCGLAGGNWKIVKDIINDNSKNIYITVVNFSKTKSVPETKSPFNIFDFS